VPGKSEKHYVFVSRLATCAQVGLGLVYALLVTRVKSAFFLTTAIGSGAGLVYALRWYWWRVNAWSEIAAMSAGLCNLAIFRFVIFPTEQQFNDHPVQVLLWAGLVVSCVWITVTLLTKPSDIEQLKRFYARVRPAGPFWGPIARQVTEESGPINPGYSVARGLLCWVSATGMVLCILFGSGKLLLGSSWTGAIILALALVLLFILQRSLRRSGAIVVEPLAAPVGPENLQTARI
jgi:solute:Na+ symporter, SSS family